MTQKTIQRDDLDEILDRADGFRAEIDWDGVRGDYSGRGMYGSECLGIVMPSETALALFGMAAFQFETELEERDELEQRDWRADELIRGARSDSMGRDVIYYFPGYRLAE